MATPASASGAVKDARTPTAENGTVPATRRQRHSGSHATPSGTASCGQTIDTSSEVRVTEQKGPTSICGGIAVPGANRHTAKVPSTSTRFDSRGDSGEGLDVSIRSDTSCPYSQCPGGRTVRG